MATHNAYPEGRLIRFQARDGTVWERTLVKVMHLPETDVSVAQLDSPISEDHIRPVRVLSVSDTLKRFFNSLPAEKDKRPTIPVVCVNRDRSATLQILAGIQKRVILLPPSAAGERGGRYQPFFVQPISGTSGCPLLFIINDEPVLLGHYSTAKPETGPFYGFLLDKINQAIAGFGDADRVQSADLSQFPWFEIPGALGRL